MISSVGVVEGRLLSAAAEPALGSFTARSWVKSGSTKAVGTGVGGAGSVGAGAVIVSEGVAGPGTTGVFTREHDVVTANKNKSNAYNIVLFMITS